MISAEVRAHHDAANTVWRFCSPRRSLSQSHNGKPASRSFHNLTLFRKNAPPSTQGPRWIPFPWGLCGAVSVSKPVDAEQCSPSWLKTKLRPCVNKAGEGVEGERRSLSTLAHSETIMSAREVFYPAAPEKANTGAHLRTAHVLTLEGNLYPLWKALNS